MNRHKKEVILEEVNCSLRSVRESLLLYLTYSVFEFNWTQDTLPGEREYIID
jgi:hypothetical protein